MNPIKCLLTNPKFQPFRRCPKSDEGTDEKRKEDTEWAVLVVHMPVEILSGGLDEEVIKGFYLAMEKILHPPLSGSPGLPKGANKAMSKSFATGFAKAIGRRLLYPFRG